MAKKDATSRPERRWRRTPDHPFYQEKGRRWHGRGPLRAGTDQAAAAEAARAPRWNPNWDPKYRKERREWNAKGSSDQNYGAFVARVPARWDRAENWFRKAPHEPGYKK